jgi:peroxiredoxin
VTKPILALALILAACGGAGEPAERPPTRIAIGEGASAIDATTIVGKPAPAWDVEWFGEPVTLDDLRGQVVLVRWFTEGCPYCKSTAPTLVALHDELAARGLAVIGIYHHKSDAPLVAEDVRAFADELGFRFPIAIDRGWRTLDRWWMDDHPTSWTSVSFLIDRRGVVRYVHTGGAYAPGSADAAQMRAWIDALLADPA